MIKGREKERKGGIKRMRTKGVHGVVIITTLRRTGSGVPMIVRTYPCLVNTWNSEREVGDIQLQTNKHIKLSISRM